MMRRSLLMLVLLSSLTAAAQAPPDPQAAREAWQRFVSEAEAERLRRERDRDIQAHREAQTGTVLTADQVRDAENRKKQRVREKTYQELRIALQDFQSAHRELDDALGAQAKLKTPAGKLEKSTGLFLKFLKAKTKERGQFDAVELKDLPHSALARETLAAARQMAPALASVVAIERVDTVNVTYLSVLPALERELLRLQWLARQLK